MQEIDPDKKEMEQMLNDIMQLASGMTASDIHLSVGSHPLVRVNGTLLPLVRFPVLTAELTLNAVKQCLSRDKLEVLFRKGEVDSALSVPGVARYRINAFRQRNTYSLALRQQPFTIPRLETLGLPEVVRRFAELKSGLVLVTGVTGSGKSTTLAALIDIINSHRKAHIITIEEPIEYLHRHRNCLVNQREVGMDSESFSSALRAALREDPDIIMVGEMRDHETISTALTAAETGHLVFSTLHTAGAVKTVDRIIDVFPANQQNQIRSQLATVLEGIITQQLVPSANGKGMVAACEVLIANSAVRNLIREGKPYQIQSVMQTGTMNGMATMDTALEKLYNEGRISHEELNARASHDKNTLYAGR